MKIYENRNYKIIGGKKLENAPLFDLGTRSGNNAKEVVKGAVYNESMKCKK